MKLSRRPGKDRLLSLVAAFQGRRIAVVADLVMDEFLNGRVERISREAPVLILQYEGSDLRLGGGANAVHNIKALGGEPFPVGFVGEVEKLFSNIRSLRPRDSKARDVRQLDEQPSR